MNRIWFILLEALFFQASYAGAGWDHYVYSYDSAGNIISRFKALPGRDGGNGICSGSNWTDKHHM